MPTERYVLIVTGIVTYPSEDTSLRDLLLSKGDNRGRLSEALQELEEEATDVKVVLEKLS